MPNYDIIPLAVDLLDYTIQRVKTKEPEYRKIKALVQENGQLAERELFEKIRDDGKPHFPKSQTFHLCARLEECATTILEKCISADGRYFETDFEDRLKDLDAVLVACDTMLQHINLSFKKKYITGDQCHYWAELVRPVRQKAFSWRRNDGNRAAALREAKRAQELAKMSQMAQTGGRPFWKTNLPIYAPLRCYTKHTLRHAGANAPEPQPHTMRCIFWKTSSTLCIS